MKLLIGTKNTDILNRIELDFGDYLMDIQGFTLEKADEITKNVLKLQLQINRNMLHFIEFGSKKIEFIIKYSTRKTLGIKVSPDKTVQVSVPLETNMEEIEKWVYKKKQDGFSSNKIILIRLIYMILIMK